MNSKTTPNVLVLSRTYPNCVTPVLGLWVEGLVRHISPLCNIKVVAPTPYCPPLPGLREFTKYRTVEKRRTAHGVDVLHPRFLTGPGYSTYNFEGSSYYWSIRQQVDRLREEFPFDVIHANFGYPDGVVAAKLAARYKVPFVITEHASWIPWMDNYPQIRRQAVQAASQCAFHIAVSSFTRKTIAHFTGETQKLRVIPNGVDTKVFTPLPETKQPNLNQILCVGVTRHVKGIDILLQAMSRIVKEKPELKLVIVGGGFNRNYSQEELNLRSMSEKLGLGDNVEFIGIKSPSEVADYMRKSALLVLPSRRETFGTVLIEALACGTPVVATDCGGPVDIVNKNVGLLVPVDDPKSLSDSMMSVIKERTVFDRQKIREYALTNFSWDRLASQTVALYEQAMN
jgi:teichuronic acid biosynthesis glycosyltransferase TuaC